MKRTPFKRNPCAMKRSKLKPISKKKGREMRKYHPARNAFLAKPENRWCMICVCMRHDIHFDEATYAMQNPGGYLQDVCRNDASGIRPSVEVHHRRGRTSSLLSDERWFCASCRECREVPHQEIIKARKLGLIASAKDWNRTVPKEEK